MGKSAQLRLYGVQTGSGARLGQSRFVEAGSDNQGRMKPGEVGEIIVVSEPRLMDQAWSLGSGRLARTALGSIAIFCYLGGGGGLSPCIYSVTRGA